MTDHAALDLAGGREAAISEASQVFDDAVELDRLRFVRMVGQLQAIRLEKNNATGRDKKLTDAIKDFLAKVGESELVDGEIGAAAWTETRGGGFIYDIASLIENEPDAALILLSAATVMAVRLDDGIITRADRGNGAIWIDTLMKYRMPGPGTVALHVGTVEEMEKRNG